MLGQVIALGRAVIINRRTWRNGKLSIQLLAKASSEKLIGRADRVNAGEAQFFHQSILVNAVIAFHSSFGFRRVSRDDLNPQLLAGPAKMGPGRPPCSSNNTSGHALQTSDDANHLVVLTRRNARGARANCDGARACGSSATGPPSATNRATSRGPPCDLRAPTSQPPRLGQSQDIS